MFFFKKSYNEGGTHRAGGGRRREGGRQRDGMVWKSDGEGARPIDADVTPQHQW